MVFIGDGAGSAPETAEEISQPFVSATLWAPGEEPRECDLSTASLSDGVLWIDVESSASADDLLVRLQPLCPGLEREMLVDLLSPDDLPEGKRWHGGTVRLASSFAVYPPDALDAEGPKPDHLSPHAVYQPVELVAGDGWLITRWHDACRYCGAERVGDPLAPLPHEEIVEAAAQRWVSGKVGNAGDLGVSVMHELALTYAPTHRRFYAALEQWELRLYGLEGDTDGDEDRREQELRNLWGARARLRKWLNPLNVPGLQKDLDKAWLPAQNHDAVIEVDDRVDKALYGLLGLGETLRSSFQMLHIQKSEAERERHESTQRRIETLAAIFLIPTLIVGFYGANTWVPGEQKHWGFWVMVAVMGIFTCVGVTALWMMQRRRDSARAETRRRALSR